MLAGKEHDDVLQQLSAVNRNLTQNQVRGIRRLPLDFYDNAALYELEVQAGGGWNGIVTYVQRGPDWVLLDGSSLPIHGMNRKTPPKLDTIDRAIAYLRFFVAAIQAPDEGTFKLIDEPQDIDWLASATAAQRASIGSGIKPLIVEESPDHEWQAIGTVELGGTLSEADFRLSRVGIVSLQHDTTIGLDLPIYVQMFSDGVRVQETMETLQHAKMERDLNENLATLQKTPNDSEALQKLPSLQSALHHWKEAADAEKGWIAFVQREDKDPADLRTALLRAYQSLSWYQLFSRDFTGALAATDSAKKLNPTGLDIDVNRAHALLFLGRTSDADAIYLGNSGKKMSPGSNQIWNDVVLKDFDDLENSGLISPEFPRLRKLLQPQTK
jgi:hypothetical protein